MTGDSRSVVEDTKGTTEKYRQKVISPLWQKT